MEPSTCGGPKPKRARSSCGDIKAEFRQADTEIQPSDHTKASQNGEQGIPSIGRPSKVDNKPRPEGLEEINSHADKDEPSLVRHWVLEGDYPKRAFGDDNMMQPPLNKKRSSSSIRTKESETSETSSTPPVKSRLYESVLATARIHLELFKTTPTDSCKVLCKELLEAEQNTPKDTLFRDDVFRFTCDRIQGQNETMVFRDLTPLIVPPAEILYTFGATQLEHLEGRANMEWHRAAPLVTNTSPRPDYSVGFASTAFTEHQLRKIKAFIGPSTKNRLMATYDMYFPFLTCEVKCGNEALNVADRQNAHSGSFSVNALIALYDAVGRKMELHRKILAFSISHDHSNIRIRGHYAILDGSEPQFYRYSIRHISLEDQEGKDRWAAYKFTKNVYDKFMPRQLKRIQEALDQLPDYSFETADVSPQTAADVVQAVEEPASKRVRNEQALVN